MEAFARLIEWLFGGDPPKWLTNPWRWVRCRGFQYHSWIDTNADGLTDTCAICGTGPYAKWSPRPRSEYVIATTLGLSVLGMLLFVMVRRKHRYGIETGQASQSLRSQASLRNRG